MARMESIVITRSRPQTEADRNEIRKLRDLLASTASSDTSSTSSGQTSPTSSPRPSLSENDFQSGSWLEDPCCSDSEDPFGAEEDIDRKENSEKKKLCDWRAYRQWEEKQSGLGSRDSFQQEEKSTTGIPQDKSPSAFRFAGSDFRDKQKSTSSLNMSGTDPPNKQHKHGQTLKSAGSVKNLHHGKSSDVNLANADVPKRQHPRNWKQKEKMGRTDGTKNFQHKENNDVDASGKKSHTQPFPCHKNLSHGTSQPPSVTAAKTSDRRDQTRRDEIKGKTNLVKKDTSEQKPTLFIRIHAVIMDMTVLGRVLTSKLNTEGVELKPTEKGIRRTNQFTFCSLTCDTKADVRKLRELLMKDRKKSTPLIDCSFIQFEPGQEDIKQGVNKDEQECPRQNKNQGLNKDRLMKEVEFELNHKTERSLQKHNQKMDEMEKKIDSTKEKLGDIYTIREIRAEIEALESKLEELQKQKKEFTTAMEGFHNKHVILSNQDDYEQDIKTLRRRLGVECCRLEKALPMYAHRQDIVQLVLTHPVSILLAETGSGKSTQVVQYLLDAGLADSGVIVCTQPRKVAAISLATRVAEELATNVGQDVGYKVGSKQRRSPATKIMYMTDHALLNECLTDPDLEAFSCVVVDEAHERSLYTDLLLSMVKRCLARRPNLRVIVTSATIDPQVFVDFFGSCPIMKVSGRAFPVEVIWQDSASEENEFENYEDAAVNKALEIHRKEPPGDILVFLTSAAEIQRCCDMFQQKCRGREDFQCFPLHGQLQTDEQQKAFKPLERGKRKIVFATNCAETSITIDGIKYVVDTGVAKEMRYNAKKGINSLTLSTISQSSTEQRKGRAGRTAPGRCYRLYSQRSYRAMDTISQPEILKTHLGHALLKLAALGVTPDMYDFVQSPGQDAIETALQTLRQIGALSDDVITDTGRWIARLPFDPKLGMMIWHGFKNDLLFDVVVLASLISAGSGLFYRGMSEEDRKKSDKSKIKFSHPGGDSLTSVEVYKAWLKVHEKQRSKWCMANSINMKTIRGVKETVNDVTQLLKKEANLEVTQQFSDAQETPDRLRKMIFQCNAANLCHYLGKEKAGYFAAQASRHVHFHPSSAMCSMGGNPEWVVYDQLLQTSRDFVMGITPVDDAWLKELGEEQYGFDLEQICRKKLCNVFTQPAGAHAFFTMIGPRYTKLRQYEERFAGQDSEVVVIEASREASELRIFSTGTADSVKKLMQELTEIADRSVMEVQQEVREITVGSDDSGLRVVLGQGGQLTDILMPHETRKIFVTRPSEDATENDIREKFETYGEICYIHQFPNGRNWGFIVFRTTAEAIDAAEGTRDDDSNVGQLEHRRSVKYHSEFKAKLSWCRRPCNGLGFVELSPAYLSECLQMRHFYVGNKLVNIHLNKKRPDESLCLRGLPTDVTEDLIRRSLLHNLGHREDVKGVISNVKVVREKVGKTSKTDIQHLQERLKMEFERRLKTSTVDVSVWTLRGEETAYFKAEARFSDPIEGFAACTSLQRKLSLNGVLVEIEPIISTTLRVHQRVYDACKDELDNVVKEKLESMEVEVEVLKQQEKDHCLLRIKASHTQNIVEARTFLSEVIAGDVLDCNAAPALRHLMTSAGHKMLRELEKETSSYIRVDNRTRTVSIHGSSKACTLVRGQINSYLDEVLNGAVEEMTLRGEGRPPGLLKALLLKYGDDLDTLRQETELHAIAVDYRWHRLKLTGSTENVDKVKRVIEEVSETLLKACPAKGEKDEDDIDCVACFCPIEKNDLYRLQACAHPYCKGCIKHQITIAIKNHEFPVICCQEDCVMPLAWRDFNTISRLGHFKITDLASSALSAYVLANRDKASFCTTPDCPVVYRVATEEQAEVFLCPECNVRTCTSCHTQAHDGLTCAMLRSSKKEISRLDAWVEEDRKNRRLCPRCRSPIEKTGGCNRMICGGCKVIFCWLCGKKYRTEKACYDHLVEAHDGIFDVNDLLYDDE